MTSGDTEEPAERFVRSYLAAAPTSADRDAAEALRPEARTVLAAIVEGVGEGPIPEIGDPALREGLTLASLLGRRAAVLDVTPAAALGIAPALVDGLYGVGERSVLLDPLRATIVDGYVRAREERERDLAARRAADAVAWAELAPRCFAVFLRGEQDAHALEPRIEALGRALLDGDARACVVDLRGLREPDRDRIGQLFAIHAACSMLGVRTHFVGFGEGWTQAATEARVDFSLVEMHPNVGTAVSEALRHCDLELRPASRLGEAMRRLLGR
ncbi:MAG: hypothetical protein KC619_16355 [Myxococcales bacterium]|nr:hypothetical protein [Myxococcales bacterium]